MIYTQKNNKVGEIMTQNLTKEEHLALIQESQRDITKFKDLYQHYQTIQTTLENWILSQKLSKICHSIIHHDFTSDTIYTTKEIINQYFAFLQPLYYYQMYQDTNFIYLYETHVNALQSAVQDTQLINTGLLQLFQTSLLRNKIKKNNMLLQEFQNSQAKQTLQQLYQQYQTSYTHEQWQVILQKSYLQYKQDWVSILFLKHTKESPYINNTYHLTGRFQPILQYPVSKNIIAAEMEKFKAHIKRYVTLETRTYQIQEVYQKLETLSVHELNKDKDGIRTSLLYDNGICTLADVQKTPIQTITSIKGISNQTAYKIKAKLEDFIRILEKDATSTKYPLQLDYDKPTKYTDKIIQGLYVCLKFVIVQKNFMKIQPLSEAKIKDSLQVIAQFQSDKTWFLLSDQEKQNICDTYRYLHDLLNQDSYRNHVWFIRYRFDNIQEISPSQAWEDFKNHNIKYLNCLESFIPDIFEDEQATYGLPEILAEQIAKETILPKGLTCDLRRYQVWGVKYILHQQRVLLGDEMGLGKTIQAIAAMVSLTNAQIQYFLVICPASVLFNWFKEIQRHSELHAYIGHGKTKERNEKVKAWRYYGGVLLTTYETYNNLGLTKEDESMIGMVIVDEAHYIKNPETLRSQYIRYLCTQVSRVLFLTGTPLENNVSEMLSLLEVLNEDATKQAKNYATMTTSKQFQHTIAPVYFRRKQCDVNKELPKKVESIIWCQMSQEEYDIYDNIVLTQKNPFMAMRRVSWNIPNIEHSSKVKAIRELIKNALNDKRKIIVFSYFKTTLEIIQKLFATQCSDIITGSITPAKRQEIIDNFTKSSTQHILVSQIIAGGTGLNIQAASVVIICEPQVKPSIEQQAIARAHRMGQSRTVLVYRLCCTDCIDERMLKVLEQKQQEFDTFADKSIAGEQSLSLSDIDIQTVIKEEVEAVKTRHKQHSFQTSNEGQQWAAKEYAKQQLVHQQMQNQNRTRTVTDSQRQRILRRDNFTCQLCGTWGPGAIDETGKHKSPPPNGYAVLEVDHKTPFSLGGSDDDKNLWTLCSNCNKGKSNQYID